MYFCLKEHFQNSVNSDSTKSGPTLPIHRTPCSPASAVSRWTTHTLRFGSPFLHQNAWAVAEKNYMTGRLETLHINHQQPLIAFYVILIYSVANSLAYFLKWLMQHVFTLLSFKFLVLPLTQSLYIRLFRFLPDCTWTCSSLFHLKIFPLNSASSPSYWLSPSFHIEVSSKDCLQ